MPRIRTIKPSFFTSLTIAELTYEQRLTFIGLWTHVDDEGRSVCDPRLIKAALWPLDDRTIADIERDLGALTEASLIAQYKVGSRRYLTVNGWREHQHINRPRKSELPGPGSDGSKPLTSVNTPFTEESVKPHGDLTSGKERKGRERNSCASADAERGSVEADFDEWYSTYPRKRGRAAALRAYVKARKTATASDLLDTLTQQLDALTRRGVEFCPYPATWLNQERWADVDDAKAVRRRPAADDWMNR